MMPIFESLVHLLVAVVAYVHWRNRPWVQHVNRKVVKDHRLGRLGFGSIWCGHPGANHHCTLCKLNRQNRVEPVIPPPPPVYSTGPGHTEPAISPPPPTHFNSPTKNCFDYGCTNDCPVGKTR